MEEVENNKNSIFEREPIHINNVMKKALEYLEYVSNKKDGIGGIASGFSSIDEITQGWQNGNLIVIGARPAMGKTSFLLSMMLNMVLDQSMPIPVALFSLEMSDAQVTSCLISNLCEIPNQKIRNGHMEPYEWEKMDFEIKKLHNAPIYIDDTPRLDIYQFCEKAKRLVRENGVKILFLDYLQLLIVNDKYYDNRYLELNYITRRLKALARELDIPIIVASQLNRNIEDKSRYGAEGKRPQLTDLRDSGTICDDADVVCFIHRPEFYKITEDERGNSLIGLAEFIVAKQRMGGTGDVRLKFEGAFSKFSEIEKTKLDFDIEGLRSIVDTGEVPF